MPKDYTTTSGYREPYVINGDTSYIGITEESLQGEYKTMIERVEKNGGFWVGRYETSNMNSSNFSTNAVNVVRGTTNGINYVNWYEMYKGEKAYKNAEENIGLKYSNTTSSMIWGSQWDQIMIWMKEVKNTKNTANGQYYITNALGMGNYVNNDNDTDTTAPVETGKREEYKVKNIYDLAGNVLDWTLEAYSTNFQNYRAGRGSDYENMDGSCAKAASCHYYDSYILPDMSNPKVGSRLTLY